MSESGHLTARESLLTPLYKSGRAEGVAQRLQEAISLGLIADGEQLPSEAELAGNLGVSTKTLREGLAMLREKGLVVTRRGRHGGNFVRSDASVRPGQLLQQLAALSTSQLRDMADEHVAISGAAARLAAVRADDDQLAQLKRLVDNLVSAKSIVERARADGRFHIDIAVAAQSARLTRSEAALQSASRDLLWVTTSPAPVPEQVADEHRRIWQAICDGQPHRARDLAEEHVENNYRALLKARIALGRP